MDMNAEAKWAQLLSEQPPASKPKGLYKPVVIVGNLAYTSGHLPMLPDGSIQTGRVGGDLDLKGGCAAARRAGLAILASLRAELGSLDRVRRVVKVLGLVQCNQDFQGHPAVINGCSELLADVFGPDAGVGVRSAIGAHSLPLGAAVEIEAVFEFES
jgi:enamine deaminase RidA (YjgF/YER057c/UK114 family)